MLLALVLSLALVAPSLGQAGYYDVTRVYYMDGCGNNASAYASMRARTPRANCVASGCTKDEFSEVWNVVDCNVSLADLPERPPGNLFTQFIYTFGNPLNSTCCGYPPSLTWYATGFCLTDQQITYSENCSIILQYDTSDCSGAPSGDPLDALGTNGTLGTCFFGFLGPRLYGCGAELSLDITECPAQPQAPSVPSEPVPEPAAPTVDELLEILNNPTARAAVVSALQDALVPSATVTAEAPTQDGDVIHWTINLEFDSELSPAQQQAIIEQLIVHIAAQLETDPSKVSIQLIFNPPAKRAIQASYDAVATISGATQMVASLLMSMVILALFI